MDDIILGEGVFAVGASLGAMVDIGVVRGGGKFSIERDIRQIEADGDLGPVKGRLRLVKEVPKLTVNSLELLRGNLTKFYPGMNLNTADSGKDVLTSTVTIATADYNYVTFTGKNQAGQQIYIELQNAINLENLDWAFKAKDEVVAALTFTGTYDEASKTTSPYKVEFAKGTTYTVTFTVKDSGATPIVGASVSFNNQTVVTIAGGIAAFTGVAVGTNIPFSVISGGKQTYFGAVTVDGVEAVTVTMTDIA